MDASGQSQQFTARRLAAPSECEPFAFLQASETGRILTMKPLVIAGRAFQSRLIVGTGKYKDGAETQAAIEASGAEMVTVAVRRVNLDRSSEWLRARLAEHGEPANSAGTDHRSAPDCGRRCGNGLRCRGCDGVGFRCGSDEHGDCGGERSATDGGGDAACGLGRTAGVSRGQS